MAFRLLLTLHIFGAIVGLGPSFVWPVAGPVLARAQPAEALGILRLMKAVTSALIVPVVLVVQPLTGALLIFETGRDDGFFEYEWLWIAIALYALTYGIFLVDLPNLRKQVHMLAEGRQDTPEFGAITKRTTINGVALGVLVTAIIFLMAWQPGE